MQSEKTVERSQGRFTDSEFVFSIRLFGEAREILVVKATSKGDFFAFPPYARVPHLLKHATGRAAGPPVDIHVSRHRSGERHFRWKLGSNRIPMPETIVKLQPTSQFSGTELLIQMPLFKGQFPDLPVSGTNRGAPVVLDLLGFRDDFLAVRAYLAAPARANDIPKPLNVGPYVQHIEKRVTPWVVVEVFQEAMPC